VCAAFLVEIGQQDDLIFEALKMALTWSRVVPVPLYPCR
jgi:hypothetical protein